jgi:DHA1 family multidrug resistance protein-like MFS transporter
MANDRNGDEAEVAGRSKELRSSEGTDRPTTSDTTSSTSSSSSVDYDPQLHTLRSRATEVDLERHATRTSDALSRINTQRLQHALTVGESVKSHPSRAPLPPFGAGKPYPPPLPAREDYVVEFDGQDDPLYPQNWSLGKK